MHIYLEILRQVGGKLQQIFCIQNSCRSAWLRVQNIGNICFAREGVKFIFPKFWRAIWKIQHHPLFERHF